MKIDDVAKKILQTQVRKTTMGIEVGVKQAREKQKEEEKK